jgi:SIR2-like domain
MSPTMTTRDDFEDVETLKEYLAGQLKKGRLALVLGSGISQPVGLPGWEKLIGTLFEMKGEKLPSGSSKLEQLAEYFRHEFYKDDYEGYVQAIHGALYKDVEMGFGSLMEKSRTLSAIGSLVMASRRGSASNIITFNFDNLLETFLNYHGFVAEPVFDIPHWATYSDVTVYHPHGMISFLDGVFSKNVVFDQESYSEVIGKESDPWHQLAVTLMRSQTCLFIGLSGADGHLDSLLKSVQKVHAVSLERTRYWGIAFSVDDSRVNSTQWERRGIFFKKIDDYEVALPEFLFAICQSASRIR